MTPSEWVRVRHWLLPTFVDEDEAAVIGEIYANRAKLWAGKKSALVTQCIAEPACLHFWKAGGDLAEILTFAPGVEAWGRAVGCKWATINGRKGWERALKPLGYFPRDGELWKEL